MEVRQKTVTFYLTRRGESPFLDWFESLTDGTTQDVINNRIARLRKGNVGDCKGVGFGVFELRIHFGPGYRIYFGQEADSLVVLLIGGDKSSQEKDIRKAKVYWYDYQEQKKAKI